MQKKLGMMFSHSDPPKTERLPESKVWEKDDDCHRHLKHHKDKMDDIRPYSTLSGTRKASDRLPRDTRKMSTVTSGEATATEEDMSEHMCQDEQLKSQPGSLVDRVLRDHNTILDLYDEFLLSGTE